MSKLSDYSRFDHLYDSDEEGGPSQAKGDQAISHHEQQEEEEDLAPPAVATTRKDETTGRYVFEYEGTTIYEWEQSLEEVNIYVTAPQGVKASQLLCNITSNRLQLGLRGNDRYFIDEETCSRVDTGESSWCMDEQGVINIVLIKAHRGETWESALKGQAVVDAYTKQAIQKDLMLERFQEENPGFDFRDAEFSGSVPDSRTFMGGHHEPIKPMRDILGLYRIDLPSKTLQCHFLARKRMWSVEIVDVRLPPDPKDFFSPVKFEAASQTGGRQEGRCLRRAINRPKTLQIG